MSYKELLEKEGLKESELSPSIKRLVATYKNLSSAITEVKLRLTNEKATLSAVEEADLSSQLADGEAQLQEYDEDIVKKIKAWIPQRERLRKQGKELQEKRNSGKHTRPVEPIVQATEPVIPEPVTPPAGEPVKEPENVPNPAPGILPVDPIPPVEPIVQTTEPVIPEPVTPPAGEPVKEPENVPNPVSEPPAKKEKDGKVSWGVIGLLAAGVVGVFFGINYLNNRH